MMTNEEILNELYVRRETIERNLFDRKMAGEPSALNINYLQKSLKDINERIKFYEGLVKSDFS